MRNNCLSICSIKEQALALIKQNTRGVDKKQQQIFDLSMQRAALRQYLRDNSDNMTESEINRVLDRINLLSKVIEALEKE
ncbi:hypothetical protein [Spirosoma radiotolerans]|uniref:hypothetical protein n=1 Tax=Spirosoma radiotolerans TaxID=1379870 RepID=UPI000B145E72|nr:hypothetical protein [Spirosoma radiotolerans]